jgi:hypothetical protein
MKIGIDFHNTLDKYPEKFRDLALSILKNSGSIYIITGHSITEEFKCKLLSIFPYVDNIYSITDDLIKHGELFEIDNKGGKIFDQYLWDSAKASYCKNNDIDIMFDDSEVYGKYFIDKTIYCKVG